MNPSLNLRSFRNLSEHAIEVRLCLPTRQNISLDLHWFVHMSKLCVKFILVARMCKNISLHWQCCSWVRQHTTQNWHYACQGVKFAGLSLQLLFLNMQKQIVRLKPCWSKCQSTLLHLYLSVNMSKHAVQLTWFVSMFQNTPLNLFSVNISKHAVKSTLVVPMSQNTSSNWH